MRNANKLDVVFDLLINQLAMLKDIVRLGFDPRPSLTILHSTLIASDVPDKTKISIFYNYVLIIVAELLHIVSPVYLLDVLVILKLTIITKNQGNLITLNMILDGLVVRTANASRFLTNECRNECDSLIKAINSSEKHCQLSNSRAAQTPSYSYWGKSSIKYQQSNIVLAFDIAVWTDEVLLNSSNGAISNSNLSKFVLQLEIANEMQISVQALLRALLLCPIDVVPQNIWLKIWTIMMSVVKNNVSVSIDMIYFTLYLLAKETEGEKQLALLRGLAEFACVKVCLI